MKKNIRIITNFTRYCGIMGVDLWEMTLPPYIVGYCLHCRILLIVKLHHLVPFMYRPSPDIFLLFVPWKLHQIWFIKETTKVIWRINLLGISISIYTFPNLIIQIFRYALWSFPEIAFSLTLNNMYRALFVNCGKRSNCHPFIFQFSANNYMVQNIIMSEMVPLAANESMLSISYSVTFYF